MGNFKTQKKGNRTIGGVKTKTQNNPKKKKRRGKKINKP